jgi:Fis family transcriptional regulator
MQMGVVRKSSRPRRDRPVRSTAEAHGTVSLRDHAESALDAYFEKLNGHRPSGLYALVMREIEEPLFRAVMAYVDGNQSHAAQVLGINRGTLRRKLGDYGLDG